MWFLVNQFFWKVLEFWRTSSSNTTILLWNVGLVKEKDLVPQIFCSNSILIEKYIRFLSSILASTSTTLSWESWENILDVDDDVHEATHDEAPIGIAQPPKNLSQPIHRFSSLDGYTFFDFYRCFVRFLGVFYFWKPWIIIRTYLPLTSLFLNARGVERNEIDTYRKICGPFWRQKCTTT